MKEMTDKTGQKSGETLPLFHGLAELGVTGKEMAAALRVSTASVSKWRNGHAEMPAEVTVFLTLMLADQLAQAIEYGDQLSQREDALEQVQAALTRQERLNQGVSAMAVREGARRYRLWWNAQRNAAQLTPDNQLLVAGLEPLRRIH